MKVEGKIVKINNVHISAKSILVIGDVMLDTYYNGSVDRISPEAPVPVFKKKSERSVLGGAANVAANLVAAEQKVAVMSIVGADDNGESLKRKFEEQGIDTSLIFSLDRPTTVKTRFIADNNQQVMRLDIEESSNLSDSEYQMLIENLKSKIGNYDLILLSDYLKGLLSVRFTQDVLSIAKELGIPSIVDVKDPNCEKYKDAYLLKPNRKELHDLTGLPVNSDEEVIYAGEVLRKQCNAKYVLATCGARGMVLIGKEKPYFINSVGREVYDVTGAGDTTIAYLAACIANSVSIQDSVDIANIAAGIQVAKVGTSAIYWHEIKASLVHESKDIDNKLLDNDELEKFRKQNANRKIVFTNGCFDILHIGHIRYLQEAAKLGDLLVVGLNSDASVRRLKGEDRPINSENDRAELLSALAFVSNVVIFEEDTPYKLIEKIQPDILVKGGDYKPDEVIGKDIVEARGGKLVLMPFVAGKSTTNIINRIKE